MASAAPRSQVVRPRVIDLYDRETMPANLREAHERNDLALERLYIGRRFKYHC